MAASRVSTGAIIDAVQEYGGASITDAIALARAQQGYDRVLAGEDPRGGVHQWSFMVLTVTQRMWADVLTAATTVSGGTYDETNDRIVNFLFIGH